MDHLEVIIKNIPKPLTKYDQWVGWVFEENQAGQRTKVPKNIIKGYNASTKKPEHWVSFKTCRKHLHKFDGIGFVTTINDPFVIWDIDDCCDISSGMINKKAKDLIRKLDSYTEYSPSGKGIRIIVRGAIGPLGRRNRLEKVEVYDSKHYLTITGHHLKSPPPVIRIRKKVCEELHKTIFAKQIRNALKNKNIDPFPDLPKLF
jgi:putative DNA primase/helicase